MQAIDDDLRNLDSDAAIGRVVRYCEENRSAILAAISFDAAKIAHATSFTILFKLLRRWGGSDLYIPQTPKPSRKIVQELGGNAAQTIIELFGHGCLPIPALSGVRRAIERQVRNVRIVELRERGLPRTAIARRLGIHVKTVMRVLGSSQATSEAQSVANRVTA